MRRDIEFDAEGTTLRGWFFAPDQGAGPFPTPKQLPSSTAWIAQHLRAG